MRDDDPESVQIRPLLHQPKKVADRPHSVTITLAILGVAVTAAVAYCNNSRKNPPVSLQPLFIQSPAQASLPNPAQPDAQKPATLEFQNETARVLKPVAQDKLVGGVAVGGLEYGFDVYNPGSAIWHVSYDLTFVAPPGWILKPLVFRPGSDKPGEGSYDKIPIDDIAAGATINHQSTANFYLTDAAWSSYQTHERQKFRVGERFKLEGRLRYTDSAGVSHEIPWCWLISELAPGPRRCDGPPLKSQPVPKSFGEAIRDATKRQD